MTALGGVLVAGAVVVAVWVVAGQGAVWVLHHIDGISDKELAAKDRADALNSIRGQALGVLTGVLATVAIYYTAHNATTARRALAHSQQAARRTAELTEQGQVTERYTKAIEQLGSDKLDIRIGGIYALERIARDSTRDQPTIVEVLAAFIREHSHDRDANAIGRLRPDLQAALTVLARRRSDNTLVDLRNAALRTAGLNAANLLSASLRSADLREAHLILARMESAILDGANLASAHMLRANLHNASLCGADLTGADLPQANLSGADLTRANLTGANLSGADLTRANLTGANLRDANLADANLSDADLSETRFADLADSTGVPRVPPPDPQPF
jgi:uncharacterized protein YjbI with pentapeptide repeats